MIKTVETRDGEVWTRLYFKDALTHMSSPVRNVTVFTSFSHQVVKESKRETERDSGHTDKDDDKDN